MNTKAPAPIDYSEAKSRVLALSHAGKLSDSTVNRFAVHGQRTNLVAALSLLADVAIEVIEPLLRGSDCYGLVVACRASRLNWQTTLAVIESRSARRRLTQEELEQGKELFEALSLSIAQRTIRFGSMRDLAKPGLTAHPLRRSEGDLMAWGARKAERVRLENRYPVNLMGVDGTWRRSCILVDVSATGARLSGRRIA